MKKNNLYIVIGILVITILLLTLTLVFEVLKLFLWAGIFFVSFMALAGIIIFASFVIALLKLRKLIKLNGLKQTLIPLLKKFTLYSLSFMFLLFVFNHQLKILESIFSGTILSLISIINSGNHE